MYTSTITNAVAPVGPHPFLCHNCEGGCGGPTCECGWSACACDGCRQSLRKERYAPREFLHDVVRGLLAVGCAGGSTAPEPASAPVDKAAPVETPPAAPPAAPTKTDTATFRALLRMCGLSHAEAAVVLGQSESSVKKKSAGSLAMTSADRIALRTVWNRICNGDLDGLQPGSREAAAALRELEE